MDEIQSYGESSGLKTETVQILGLMLDEPVSNSVIHGGMAQDATIAVNLIGEGDYRLLRYHNTGIGFNPSTDLPPDTRHKKLGERPVGGLGWALIFYYADSVKHRREANTNVYDIRVSLDQPGEL